MGTGKVFIFHTVTTGARFQRQKLSKSFTWLCKSSHTPASITTSLGAFICSLFMVPQVTKRSLVQVPWIGDWREAAATKLMEKTLQPPLIHSILLCGPSCEPAPNLCWSMVKTPPLVLMIFMNFVDLDRKILLFSPFFLHSPSSLCVSSSWICPFFYNYEAQSTSESFH